MTDVAQVELIHEDETDEDRRWVMKSWSNNLVNLLQDGDTLEMLREMTLTEHSNGVHMLMKSVFYLRHDLIAWCERTR
jgi:hypothetical protein